MDRDTLSSRLLQDQEASVGPYCSRKFYNVDTHVACPTTLVCRKGEEHGTDRCPIVSRWNLRKTNSGAGRDCTDELLLLMRRRRPPRSIVMNEGFAVSLLHVYWSTGGNAGACHQCKTCLSAGPSPGIVRACEAPKPCHPT
jgi:hypothetical protein